MFEGSSDFCLVFCLCSENREGYRGEVASEFAVLIKSLWSGQYKAVSPRDFRVRKCSKLLMAVLHNRITVY